jgi:hypothetical protein
MPELKDIFVEGTPKSPQIDFNHLTGELKLFGRSFPENALQVYEPLLLWINDYIKSPPLTTNLYLKLEYFNTSSLLCIVRMVKALSKIEEKDSFLYIHLYFDDEDFEVKDVDNLRDVISSQFNDIGELKITIGIKIHGTDKDGNAIEESIVLVQDLST